MPHSRSAWKSLHVAQRRHERNRGARSALRTYVRQARSSVTAGSASEAPELVRLAASQLDKAASKGIIHKNQAARRKSRLMRKLAALEAVARAGEMEGAAAEAAAPAAAAPRARGRARAQPAPAEAAPTPARRTRARQAPAGEGQAPAPAPRTRRPRASQTKE